VLTGTQRIIKTGAGTLEVTQDNAATLTGGFRLGTAGLTPVDGGKLKIGNKNALGTGDLQFNYGTLEATSAFTGSNAISNGLSIGGRTGAAAVLAGSDMDFTGAVSFFRAGGTSGELVLTVNNTTKMSGTLGAETATGGTTTGITLGGTGKLIVAGDWSSNVRRLTIADSLTLEATADGALGTTAEGTIISDGAALKLTNVNYTLAEALTLNGTGISNGGALVNSGTSTYAGTITAATDSTINAGGGSLTLTGGVVKDGTTLTVAGGGTVQINTTGITGASANSDLVVDGTTLVVNANSNYNGPTTVQNNGTLIANAEIDTTSVTIDLGSTLGGTGKVDAATNGSIFINGTLQVGDTSTVADLELLTSGTGSTAAGAGSIFSFDLFSNAGDNTSIASAADRLILGGFLDFNAGGTLRLFNQGGFNFNDGDQWVIFDLTTVPGTNTISTGFVLDTSNLVLGGLTGNFNNATGVFSVTAVPEPSRALLLLAGIGATLLRRRRPQRPL
jgi:hypothetical protein